MDEKTFEIPILIRVKAADKKEARSKISAYMNGAANNAFEHLPSLYESIIWVGTASIRGKSAL